MNSPPFLSLSLSYTGGFLKKFDITWDVQGVSGILILFHNLLTCANDHKF